MGPNSLLRYKSEKYRTKKQSTAIILFKKIVVLREIFSKSRYISKSQKHRLYILILIFHSVNQIASVILIFVHRVQCNDSNNVIYI